MKRVEALFEKISADLALQMKFTNIISMAESVEEAERNLEAFAKEVGFAVSFEEIRTCFQLLSERDNRELEEKELDAVAGGMPILIGETSANIFELNCAKISTDFMYGFCSGQ